MGPLTEAALGWVFLEVLAALAIAVAIVWWTFPKKPKGESREPPAKPPDERGS